MEKEIVKKLKIHWPLLLVVLVSLLGGWALLRPGYFSMHDDLQVMRLHQMEKCLQEGQIPCRWAPDLGAGYGQPLYNFYSVFPYYLGIIFRLFGISLIDITKILFFLALILAAIFMYILTKEFFGRFAGAVAASFYALAPYHAVEIYVRGALTEAWAVAFFPLVFWAIYKLIREEKFPFFLVSIASLAFLFLSHNIMTLVFTPLAFVWGIYWVVQDQRWGRSLLLGAVFVWAVALAAFFLLPAFFEKSLVKIETLTSDYYNFRHHYAAVRQLFFDRSWGYGPSRTSAEDDLSFQIGWPHWWLVIISGGVFLYHFFRKKRKRLGSIVFFLAFFGLAIFMTHAKSVFLWESIPSLAFVQFPWRFLAVAMFASSFLAGATVGFFKKGRKQVVSGLALIGLLILLNWGYFHPERYFPQMTDNKKLSGAEWRSQSMATLLDYMPKGVKDFPEELAPESPWVVEGEARIAEFRERSDFWRFTVEAVSNQQSTVEVPVFDFPHWEVLIDQTVVAHAVNLETGVIQVQVPPGSHTVVGWFRNTPLRRLANFISLFSFACLILAIVWTEQKNGKSKKIF